MSPEHPDAEISRPNLLQLMKRARIWLYWKSIPVPGKKPKKVPFYVNGKPRGAELELDTPADREQLTDYEEAVARFDKAKYTGLAIALGPDGGGGCWQGVDGDNIVANGLGDIADRVTRGDLAGYGYVEQSPSGDGIHVLGYGRSFQSMGPNSSGIEAYAGGRFFTFTGRPIVGDSPCYVYDLADYVELVLAPRHDAARTARLDRSEGQVHVDPKVITELRSALTFLRADDRDQWML